MSAPGALAPRFWGNASANHMSVTSLREHSPPHQMARHRILRRAVASASAKMPRRWCILGLTDRQFRDAEYADIAYVGAGRPCKALLERRVRKSYVRDVVARTFTASANGASPNFTARSGVGVGEDAAKMVYSGADRQKVQRRRVRLHRLCRRRAALQGASGATRPQIICP